MTGSQMFRLNEAAKDAVSNAGSGELSGLKLIKRLNELGVDLVLMDLPPKQTPGLGPNPGEAC